MFEKTSAPFKNCENSLNFTAKSLQYAKTPVFLSENSLTKI